VGCYRDGVLIPVERLLIRFRQVPSRAEELLALRARVRAAAAEDTGAEERTLARELRELKQRAAAALANVSACAHCAEGKRWPRGAFTGGDCCSGVTADLFSDDEVAALAQAGTRPHHLRAPRTAHAGCAFRGEIGCTLAATHRPQRCVHYTCHVLRRELRAKGELEAVDALMNQLKERMAAHVALRRARLDDEILGPLEEALSATADARNA
jgi:hypothetical protein